MNIPAAPNPCQHLALSFFFFKAIKIDVWGYLIVNLICISDVQQLFMDSFAIMYLFLVKQLFKFFVLNWVVF